MNWIIAVTAAVLVTLGFNGTIGHSAPANAPACWAEHEGINRPCDSHGKLVDPVEWRITDKQGLDHDCWRLVMTLAHPGPDDPDESTYTDCNTQAVYDHYRVGDSYWAPDSMTMLRG